MKRFVLCLFLCALVVALPFTASAKDRHRAGVLVRNADGTVSKMCVLFNESSITGEELLRRSGLKVVSKPSSLGTSVCKIGKTGCTTGNCFCKFPSFWGYWTQDPGKNKWTFAEIGMSERKVSDGSLDAWVWGKGDKGPKPPTASIGSVCTASLAAQASIPAHRGGTNRANALIGFGAALLLSSAAAGVVIWRRARR